MNDEERHETVPLLRVANGTQEGWFVLDIVGVNPPTSRFPSGGGLLKIGAGWEGRHPCFTAGSGHRTDRVGCRLKVH